jgi:hypothetical protein
MDFFMHWEAIKKHLREDRNPPKLPSMWKLIFTATSPE